MAHAEMPFFLHRLNASCAFVGLFLSVLTLGFTRASASRFRFVVAMTSVLLCMTALMATDRGSHEGQSFAEAMFAVSAHIFCQLVLEKEGIEAPKSAVTAWSKFTWALHMGFTLRRPRKPMGPVAPAPQKESVEHKKTASTSAVSPPAKAARDRGNSKSAAKSKRAPPKAVESPAVANVGGHQPYWRLKRLLKCILQLSLFWYLRSHSVIPNLVPTYYDFLPQPPMLISLLRGKLTLRAVLVRTEMVGISLLMPTLALCGAHNLSATLFGRDDPAAWPGLYGSLADAYSLGRWYSDFWHTLMRRGFTLPSKVVVRDALGLAPARPLGRALIILAAFAISGVMHTLTSWSPGPCENQSYTELVFHLATGVAIVGERALIEGYDSLKRYRGKEYSWLEVRFWRLVGYIWVATWWLEVFGAGVLYPWIICRARAAAR